jgi:hypothetical protein
MIPNAVGNLELNSRAAGAAGDAGGGQKVKARHFLVVSGHLSLSLSKAKTSITHTILIPRGSKFRALFGWTDFVSSQ